MTATRRMPDFAGVALVDILANGVAMLIIVVVISLAARLERDERHAEQADEVAAVMSHKFSTSLALNSIAASPPATLHNYETSPLDQILDPLTLPIIELHPTFVREYYSGALWPRRELLKEFSAMSAWLGSLGEAEKRRLRVDLYGVGQFYLAMSILREHGVKPRHWHFIRGPLSLSGAANCPPGSAAEDCINTGAFDAPPLPSLRSADDGADDDAAGGFDPDWPQLAAGDGRGGNGGGQMPGGVVAGGGAASGAFGDAQGGQGGQNDAPGGRQNGLGGGARSGADLGSFPNASGGSGGAPSAGGLSPGGRNGRIEFRRALPDVVRRAVGAGVAGAPTLEVMFGAMLHYLGELQTTLDAGGTPSSQVADFAERIQRAFATPPPLSRAERMRARELAVEFTLRELTDGAEVRRSTLAIQPAAPNEEFGGAESDHQSRQDTLLIIPPNRLLEAVGIHYGGAALPAASLEQPPERQRVSLALNAYPGIWQGLNLQLEPGSALLAPVHALQPKRMGWRAAAYVSPQLDDFVVGFVFADIDAKGNLRAQADANRVRLGGRALSSAYAESTFGARGWLVSLYAALAVGLLLLAFARRWLASEDSPNERSLNPPPSTEPMPNEGAA